MMQKYVTYKSFLKNYLTFKHNVIKYLYICTVSHINTSTSQGEIWSNYVY